MTKKNVVIYVETIAGVGHMAVVSHLAQSLEQQGAQAHIMASNHSFEQGKLYNYGTANWLLLPTFARDPETGKAKLTPNGKAYQDDIDFQQERSKAIAGHLNEIKPDVFVTETWPLGKGHFDAEMIPALESSKHALQNSKLVCIGRDIMNYPNHRGVDTDNDLRAAELLNQYFDSLIITGDDKLFTMNQSFNHADKVDIPVHYAGYYTAAPPPRQANLKSNEREVLVSTGGGYIPNHFDKIIADVIWARKDTVLKDRKWRLLLSDAYPETLRNHFKKMAQQEAPDGGIIIERLRPDFKDLLSNSAAFITTGGLNAMTESFQVRAHQAQLPTVIAPHPKSQEQMMRAQRLGKLDISGAHMKAGDPKALATLFNHEVLYPSSFNFLSLKMQGADETAKILLEINKQTAEQTPPQLDTNTALAANIADSQQELVLPQYS